jgi:hypothetical protein
MSVTLSVDEILRDILSAFKFETPELFSPGGFAQNFSSKTAALGDKITARIAKLPVIGDYDHANGGFKAASQDVTTLFDDFGVTLDQLKVCSICIPWLTDQATKGVDLYRAAIANLGYALGKNVVDQVLAKCAAGISNALPVAPQLCNLDTFDGDIRNQLNSQKAFPQRFGFINTALAQALGSDDRVRSSLFYDERCASEGWRRWTNVAGFSSLREYPDISLAGNQVAGILGDRRLAAVTVRKIEDANNIVEELGIPKVMNFTPIKDADSGLEMTGVTFMEQGSGDVYVAAAILFGISAGNNSGAPGSLTDNAGLKLLSL